MGTTRRDAVGVGLIGAGFLAETRARCYGKAAGVDARVLAVAARGVERAEQFAERWHVPHPCSVDEMLARDDIDLVDLCVPNDVHLELTRKAAKAGKHVVCTKPLTAYVGQDLPEKMRARDDAISGRDPGLMRNAAVADADEMVRVCEDAGVRLMYGENWIYAPAVRRALELCAESNGTILEMRGGESHCGSHSPYSKLWRHTGGGALLRLGAHPIGAMLHAKRHEGVRKHGEPIVPVAVTAEIGDLSKIEAVSLEKDEWLARGWRDVENWGVAIITFSDGSRGVAWGGDTMLGGMQSVLEISASNSRFTCNLSPNDMLRAYAPDEKVFGDAYLMEKLHTRGGWSTPMPDEDWTSGHLAMCTDFALAVARGRPAVASGRLGLDVVRVVYSAYMSARTGRRVEVR